MQFEFQWLNMILSAGKVHASEENFTFFLSLAHDNFSHFIISVYLINNNFLINDNKFYFKDGNLIC